MSFTVERDGVRVVGQRHSQGDPTLVFLPTWSALHSGVWKLQIPDLSRHFGTVSFDGRGNGASDRPAEPEAYTCAEFGQDTIDVLDASGVDSAILVALSCGVPWAIYAATEHPERVRGLIAIAPALSCLAPGHPERDVPFDVALDTDAGWAKYNAHYWRRAYPEFLTYFAAQCLSEPHSERQLEDFVAWGLETDPETLIAATLGMDIPDPDVPMAQRCAQLTCPVLVIHGADDRVRPLGQGAALAEVTGGELVTLVGAGHLPQLRHPVVVNRLVREFAGRRGVPARHSAHHAS